MLFPLCPYESNGFVVFLITYTATWVFYPSELLLENSACPRKLTSELLAGDSEER
jgi:hypothetical protein